jgi:nucleoid-associated protein YgaU
MHYDKKICLALGILLVGVVAALFFRNESGAGQQPPPLADAKAIDARIADKAVRPYDARHVAAAAGGGSEAGSVRHVAGDPQPQFTYDGFDSNGGKAGDFARPVDYKQFGPPEPIKPKTKGVARLARNPNPDPNAAWTAAGTSRTARNVSRTSAAGLRTYRVKRGDTLSRIAQKLLGTSRRYNEIYKANRDVLRTPNSLREGMILRIPERNAEQKANEPPVDEPIAKTSRRRRARASSRPRTASAPNTPTIADRRFIPVRRSPFLLGRRNGFVSRFSNHDGSPAANDSQASSAEGGSRKPVTILPPPNGSDRTQGLRKSLGSEPRTYVVRKGDSLERIARRMYGTRRATNKILEANRDRLKSANHLRAGMKIVLP